MSFLLVTIGSCVGGHLRFLVGVPVTIAGVVAACVAARRVREPYAERPVDAICVLLSAMAAIGLASPSPQGSIWYEILYRFLPASGLVAVGVLAAGSAAWRRRAVWFTVCTAVLLAALAPVAVPESAHRRVGLDADVRARAAAWCPSLQRSRAG